VCLADIVCACTVEQLRLLDTVKEKPDFTDIIKPYAKVRAAFFLDVCVGKLGIGLKDGYGIQAILPHGLAGQYAIAALSSFFFAPIRSLRHFASLLWRC